MIKLEKKTWKEKLINSLGVSGLLLFLGIYLFNTKSQTVDTEYTTLVKVLGVVLVVLNGIICGRILIKNYKRK